MFIKRKYYQAVEPEVTGDGGVDTTVNTPPPADEPAPAPADWRTDIAGGDETKLERFSRYSSLDAVGDALIAAQNKISSGELKSPFPADGDEAAQNEWRKSNGLPEEANGYDLSFDNGLVIGDDDKGFVDEFLKSAHASNQTPEQVKASLQWYYDNQNAQVEEQNKLDTQARVETEDKLRVEWGPEYRSNMNAVQSLMDTMPADIKEDFSSARLGDGTPLLSSPLFIQWALDKSLELNPTSTLVPPSGNMTASINDEIADIEKMMGDKKSDYWVGPKADNLQKRLRQLYEARDRQK